MSFETSIAVLCTAPGCTKRIAFTGKDMTRGQAMDKARAEGWRHISAEKHLCPKHAEETKPAPAAKPAKPAKAAKAKTTGKTGKKPKNEKPTPVVGQAINLKAIRDRLKNEAEQ